MLLLYLYSHNYKYDIYCILLAFFCSSRVQGSYFCNTCRMLLLWGADMVPGHPQLLTCPQIGAGHWMILWLMWSFIGYLDAFLKEVRHAVHQEKVVLLQLQNNIVAGWLVQWLSSLTPSIMELTCLSLHGRRMHDLAERQRNSKMLMC